MIEKDVFTALKTVCDRVYPSMMPDDAVFPLITYFDVYKGVNQSFNSGRIMSFDVRFQVDIFAESFSEVKNLEQLVWQKASDLNGGSISSTYIYEDSIKLHRQLIDFTIKRI